MTSADDSEKRTHFSFTISLRVRHPTMDPVIIGDALAIEPGISWKAGEPRQTPTGTPLPGVYPDTYWTAKIAAGHWPLNINDAIHKALIDLVHHRPFFHRVRKEGGTVEFFIGWFFENQSGDVLTHQCLALAGDLQIDLSFDIYLSG